ncbi:hypothetical protein [Advenella mimigardefordensis]|uniref:hypothetical protein n=1 Tax=Advenella mimigardefordensis TaxID=302406 RepID=UPI00046D6158|nr:hypothetical protein [Advenella mimigardefordensis]
MTEQYKLVPVEPTFDMCEAFEESFISNKGMNWRWRIDAGYKAMLAAAPVQLSPAETLDREAIRNEVLEEAALKIESMKPGSTIDIVVQSFADTIRALKSQPAQPSDSQADVSDVEALLRIQSYLDRKAKDRQADPELIHTYDGIFELRTEDIRSLFKAAMRAQEQS